MANRQCFSARVLSSVTCSEMIVNDWKTTHAVASLQHCTMTVSQIQEVVLTDHRQMVQKRLQRKSEY